MREPSVPHTDRLTLRWTIGDARPRGFEMLRLSIACAAQLFGSRARYVVCVNSVGVEEARPRTGDLPLPVEWLPVTRADLPGFLQPHFDDSLSEGTGWKLAPLRLDPDRYELALDNDCILWAVPDAMSRWLELPHATLLAQDVARCLGRFDPLCPPGAFNSGIRGLPPGDDFAAAIAALLREITSRPGTPLPLTSETDEQGLQAAAVARLSPPLLVTTAEVSICSPFWPRSPELGSCGAHFVGMNARHVPWDYYDRPADAWMAEHWQRHRAELYRRAELPLAPPAAPLSRANTVPSSPS